MDIREHLIANDASTYGDQYRSHCLEIYKVYVGMAEAISDRRQTANTFFLTLNTGIVAAWGFLFEKSPDLWHRDILMIAGMGICYAWYRLIRSYKDLNTAKFKVIHEIEKELPLSPLDAEWEAVGRGERKDLYLPFTDIEPMIPRVFGLLYIALVLTSVVSMFGE